MSRYKAYPEYKDSGVEWVGAIPNSWDVSPLFSLASTDVLKNDDGAENNVLSLSYGRIIRRDVEDNHGLLPESFNTYQLVAAGDIILRLTDLQNDKRSLRVGLACEKGIITSAYLKLTAKQIFLDRYLYRLLHSYDTTKVFYGMGGGLRQSMKFEEMRRLQMLCPSLDEQKQIADFLDHETAKIDALIEKQQRLIELLKEKRQAVISHAVTKGLNPNAPMKDSGVEWLGEVPAHWDVHAIKHIVSTPITDGPHETPEFFDTGIPFVSAEAVSSGRIDFEKIRAHISDADNQRYSKKYSPKKFDIYMVKSGATTGVTAIVETDDVFNIWSPLAAIRCNELSYPYFVLNFMRSRNFADAVAISWSFGTQQNIGMKVIENLSITRPPLSEAIEIAQSLQEKSAKFDKIILQAQGQIELMQERRTALISAAVTGKIDVRDWQPAAAQEEVSVEC
jgi:type I restriction enzyme S subunit